MAKGTDDLTYGVLTRVQTRLGNREHGQRELKTELYAFRGYMRARQADMQTDVSNPYAGQAKIERRPERTERRLELADVLA